MNHKFNPYLYLLSLCFCLYFLPGCGSDVERKIEVTIKSEDKPPAETQEKPEIFKDPQTFITDNSKPGFDQQLAMADTKKSKPSQAGSSSSAPDLSVPVQAKADLQAEMKPGTTLPTEASGAPPGVIMLPPPGPPPVVPEIMELAPVLREHPELFRDIFIQCAKTLQKEEVPQEIQGQQWKAYEQFEEELSIEGSNPEKKLGDFSHLLLGLRLPPDKLKRGILDGLSIFKRKMETLKLNPEAKVQNETLDCELRNKLYQKFDEFPDSEDNPEQDKLRESIDQDFKLVDLLLLDYSENTRSLEILRNIAAKLKVEIKDILTGEQLKIIDSIK
ncbi:MAG: hypothetical protein PHW04_15315 [Candidatus Wallbacteria bacterium]|nr:hypothetical protein [Candidatus Wallbacteria bacterium]